MLKHSARGFCLGPCHSSYLTWSCQARVGLPQPQAGCGGTVLMCCRGAICSMTGVPVWRVEENNHPVLTQSGIFGSQSVSNYETATNNVVMFFCPVLRLCVTNDLIRFYSAHANVALCPVYEFSNAFSRSLWELSKGRRSCSPPPWRLQWLVFLQGLWTRDITMSRILFCNQFFAVHLLSRLQRE